MTHLDESTGKWRSGWGTACKKGLIARPLLRFAKQILLSNLEGDPEEFEALLKQLREDLQPVGQLEELLVERIALCFWKSRRALRCEIAEAKQSASRPWRR